MMKKRLAFICLAAVMALSGCGAVQSGSAPVSSVSASSASAQSTEVTFTDDLDRTVTVDSPKRVAALIGSFADVWCVAGGKDTLVAAADDSWTQFDLNLPDSVMRLGSVSEPSAEALLAVQPDFIIASAKTSADVDLMPTLEDAGIPTAYFDVSTFEDYREMLEICTRITGRGDLYQQHGVEVGEQVQATIDSAADKQGPTVLYLRASGSSCKVKNSENSVLGEMLADLGCTNIADSDESLLENLSMEAILQADPEHIFIVLQGSDPSKPQQSLEKAVLSNPAWQQLSAVKNGNYYYMDQRLYNVKPNARWGEAYEGLAEILYGEAE